jgi:hypothetical protein
MQQRKITYCNSKTGLPQQHKQKAMQDVISEKGANATQKYYLLQQQNKTTATIEIKHNARCNIRKKKLIQQRNITCRNSKTSILQQSLSEP